MASQETNHEESLSIAARLQLVRDHIHRAAADCDRLDAQIELVCVSKTQPAEKILEAINTGQRIFGENRVQEAQQKWPDVKAKFPDIQLHLIGPLQSNKAKEAVEIFDVIETIDREKIAQEIAKVLKGRPSKPKLFVQVNTGSEPQKAGVLPESADSFIEFCRSQCGLHISGLMCIPPADEQCSPHFALLALIAKRNGVSELSMGMSSDYELAIQLGATFVRVGSAIFGHR